MTLKPGSRWQVPPTPRLIEERTKGGYAKRGGKVIVPKETKRLIDAWAAAGDIRGLTMAEIVDRVGYEADATPPQHLDWGDIFTWSRPGYSVSVLFGPDGRAVRIPSGSEQLG